MHTGPPEIYPYLHPLAPPYALPRLQGVCDDGTFRADPWRGWCAWVAIELIARRGPDRDGSRIRRFVLEDPSLETVRVFAPRWLAANPLRLRLIEPRLSELVDRASDAGTAPGGSIEERTRGSPGRSDRTSYREGKGGSERVK